MLFVHRLATVATGKLSPAARLTTPPLELLLPGDCDSLLTGQFLKPIGINRNSGIPQAVENGAFRKSRRAKENPRRRSDGGTCLNLGLSRETFVTLGEFSTYVDVILGLGWLHFLHCVMFCNALQQIVYQILYRVLRHVGSKCKLEISACLRCTRSIDQYFKRCSHRLHRFGFVLCHDTQEQRTSTMRKSQCEVGTNSR